MNNVVMAWLEKTAERIPDKVAYVDEKRQLTFGELQSEAYQIANYAIQNSIVKSPVAVYLEQSADCLSVFMGAAYSGNFYTPIDISLPTLRVKKIFQTLQPKLIITDEEHKEKLLECVEQGDRVALLSELLKGECNTEVVRSTAERVVEYDTLYVLFTSGSTGEPKGVTVPHRVVMNYMEWAEEKLLLDETNTFGNQAPFFFDHSLLDVFAPLKSGATTYIIPRNNFTYPIVLLNYLEEKKINSICWVPSELCLLANYKALSKVRVNGLKLIVFGGEAMPNKQLNQWRKEYPNALYANIYGPTETACCTAYIVDRDFGDDEPLPIGFPIRNIDVAVLDENNKQVPDGEMGELCVRGTGLANGYYNNLERTQKGFTQNPLNSSFIDIIYHTGDIVYYNDRKELVYVSRKDFQIKHGGHRIELGEIEVTAGAFEGVDEVCCIYHNEKIVLFYSGEAKEDSLVTHLSENLPKYMLPSKRIHLEKMPLNTNGKIDRVFLAGTLS